MVVIKESGDISKLAVKHTGLCVTCSNAGGCVYPREPAKPVLQCNEFAAAPGPARVETSPRHGEAAEQNGAGPEFGTQ